jgi:branched-chain amino acid transport system permease protein
MAINLATDKMLNPLGTIETSRLSYTSKSLIVLIVISAFVIPFLLGRGEIRLAIEFCYLVALAQMWNFLAGYAGLISVGQQAYLGVGGYALYIGTAILGMHPLLALLSASIFAFILSIFGAALLFRLQGAYFAIGTWVFAEIVSLIFAQIASLGSGSGVSLPASAVKAISGDALTRDIVTYVIACILLTASVAGPFFFLRSRYGLALMAIRDNPSAAETIGINIQRLKLLVYTLVAAFTGIVGALIFLQKLRISPASAFDVNDWSANIIFIVVIGGIGRIEGPVVGAIIFIAMRQLLADFGPWYLICLGTSAILVMLFAREGIWGFIVKKFGVELLPVNRKYNAHSNTKNN